MAPVEDKMREIRFRWFGHVKRMSVDAHVRRYEMINILKYRRDIGWPKKNLNEAIKHDLKFLGLTENTTLDKSLWRSRIKVMDHR